MPVLPEAFSDVITTNKRKSLSMAQATTTNDIKLAKIHGYSVIGAKVCDIIKTCIFCLALYFVVV